MPAPSPASNAIGPSSPRRKAIVATLFVALWASAVIASAALLMRYESTPGTAQAVHPWPADAPPFLDLRKPTLVVAIHPKCPCTRTTLVALRELVTRYPAAASVHAVFYCPDNLRAEWSDSSNAA